MAETVKYPIGIQTFSKIIEDGYVYIDKTKYVEYLAESPGYYFLSRPRRFGKSLLLSKLQAYFEGRSELFESLDIATGDTDWIHRPVFMLSLNTLDPKMPVYSGYKDYECDNLLGKMKSAIVDGEAHRFMELLKTFLDGNPFSNTELAKRERYFKNNLYLVFRALGFLPRAEEETCRSRMDLMLQTRRFIYIFELKTDGNISDAMQQIDAKGYANPYLLSGKTIIKIAANYSSSANNIDSWEIAEE